MSHTQEDQDAQARFAAQTRFDRPLALEAGAGTGKTSVLVARVVAWCLGPGWDLHSSGGDLHAEGREPADVAARVLSRVVAITFTEAAAAEMATRIAGALGALETEGTAEGVSPDALPQPDVTAERAAALSDALDRLHVQTIHSYCHSLLTAFPIEARVHPEFRVDADESLRAERVRELLERALRERWADGRDPAFQTLARRAIPPAVLEACLLTLIDRGVPPEALEEPAFSDARLDPFRTGLRESVERLRSADAGRMAAAKNAKRGVPTEAALQALDTALGGPIEDVVDVLRELFKGTVINALKAWSKGKFNQGEAAALGDDVAEVQAAARALRAHVDAALRLDPELLEAVRCALLPLLREAREELRARGIQSYDGLLEDTRRLLVDHPQVAARLRTDIDQILVDEFQDTDAIQCEILGALAFGGDARPGLFLVGDPKQSIYGWRSADLAAYESFTERLVAEGGEQHTLVVNFRSVPAILHEVARVMQPVMLAEPGIQPVFRELEPARTASSDAPAVEYWVSWGPRDDGTLGPGRAADSARLEAKVLAAELARLHRAGENLDEVALLFRARTDYDVYLSELRTAGVPYSVEGDRNFFQRREIIDAAALVRCILDPDDPLALLTWLRSAAVGVPDAALLPLWRGGFPRRVAAVRNGDDASGLAESVRAAAAAIPADPTGIERVPDWDASLLRACAALGELRSAFEREAPDVFVDRLRERTALEATESARTLGAFRLANLDRFLRRFTHELAGGTRDPQKILRGLRRAVREALEEEEGRLLSPAPAAVRVMSIHQAKGLDFEQVFVVQAHRDLHPRPDRRPVCAKHEGRWEYLLADAPSPGFAHVEERQRIVRDAETVRTLYVALTRAKNRLVVLGAWPERETDDGSHLRLLQKRRGGLPALWTAAQQCAKGSRAFIEYDGVRFVFPTLLESDAAGPQTLRERNGKRTDRVARARADAAALTAARAEAEARASRPLRGAASQEAHDRLEQIIAESGSPTRRARSRAVATRVGTEVHRLLEELDLSADPSTEFAHQRERLRARVSGDAAALEASDALLAQLEHGDLLARLFALRDRVVARELPVLFPGDEQGTGPIQSVEGVIDLVYRDPDDDTWVVADFKTDPELEGRLEPYAAQGAVYARALQEGLELERPPRVELWLLDADRVVTL